MVLTGVDDGDISYIKSQSKEQIEGCKAPNEGKTS